MPQLLNAFYESEVRNDEVSVTILCALMKTIGPKLYAIMELLKKDEEKPTKVNLPKMKEDAKFLTWVAKVFANLHTRSYSGWYLSLSSEAAVEVSIKLEKCEIPCLIKILFNF